MESILWGTNWMLMHVVYPTVKSFGLIFRAASSHRLQIEEAKLASDSIDLINSVVHKCIHEDSDENLKSKTRNICEETLDIIILKTIESIK